VKKTSQPIVGTKYIAVRIAVSYPGKKHIKSIIGKEEKI
jgi:hypothetical protein